MPSIGRRNKERSMAMWDYKLAVINHVELSLFPFPYRFKQFLKSSTSRYGIDGDFSQWKLAFG